MLSRRPRLVVDPLPPEGDQLSWASGSIPKDGPLREWQVALPFSPGVTPENLGVPQSGYG